jgi:hippurate hydrolase
MQRTPARIACWMAAGVYAAAKKAGKEVPYSLHHPDFVVDLAAIPVGTKVATVAMLELLSR